jgi:glycosyltransferase involved in cell wall biosynthesis
MTIPPEDRTKHQIVFCALETYSLVGGMQNFNRRVIRNLLSRVQSRGEPPPQMRFLRDGDSIPKDLADVARSYPNRIAFILGSAIAGLTASVFIIGHVNLLPIAALVRCFRWRTPILLFVHGDEVWNEPKRRKKRWHDSLFLRAVSRIASVSQYTADIMSQEFGVDRAKFCALPNAVDVVERPSSPGAKDTPVVLTVSRLSSGDRAKNIDQMLRAIAVLKTRIPKVRYEIVGDGALRHELEQLTRELGIGANVSFLGRLSDAELSQAYQRASVFALPSSKEGFGIVYLEAWLRSLPVICSSFGASKEIVSSGTDGFVVDHRDADAIANRLHELLTDSALALRLGENGRNKVESKYLNRSFQTNLDAIIDDLLLTATGNSPPGKDT